MESHRLAGSPIERAGAELDYRRINAGLIVLNRYAEAAQTGSPDEAEALEAALREREALEALLKTVGTDRRQRFEGLLLTFKNVLPSSEPEPIAHAFWFAHWLSACRSLLVQLLRRAESPR